MRPVYPLRSHLLATFFLATLALPVCAADFHVSRADDPPADGCQPGDCSLREAIAAAAATPEADRVLLAAGQYHVTQGQIQVLGTVEIAGIGSDQTRIVAAAPQPILALSALTALTVRGIELVNADSWAVTSNGTGAVEFDDVTVPDGSGNIATTGSAGDAFDLVIRRSRIGLGDSVICRQAAGKCHIHDSEILPGVGTDGANVSLKVVRSVIGPSDGITLNGVVVEGTSTLHVEDSIVQGTLRPLYLLADGSTAAPAARVLRTRFLDNVGPITGDRPGAVHLDEIEVHGHQSLPAMQTPAAMLVVEGPSWFLRRSLVHGNRGSGQEGGAILVLAGGRLGITSTTFHDNSFQHSAGYGDTIAVYNGTPTPAAVTIFHSTFHRGPHLAAHAPGSVLTVRGAAAQVTLGNTVLRGRCAFGGGGAIMGAVGNVEAPGGSCVPAANNFHVGEIALRMGSLADHGGFTHSFQPDPGSALLDRANPALCQLGGLDQRRYLRPADGEHCDVGAVEAGAKPDLIFTDGVES